MRKTMKTHDLRDCGGSDDEPGDLRWIKDRDNKGGRDHCGGRNNGRNSCRNN